MSADPKSFVATFPAFADAEVFPPPLIRFYLELAALMLLAARWGKLIDYGTQLFAAHHLALEAKAQQDVERGNIPGSSVGIQSARSAGPVSLSIDTNVAAEEGAGFWNLTTYGLRFYRMVRMIGMGGIQLGAPTLPWLQAISPDQRQQLISFIGVPVYGSTRGETTPPAPKESAGRTFNPALGV